jgi:excisionase family DNA binding protein
MQQQPSSIPTPEPELMTIEETMRKLRVGRSKLYRMIKNEGLPVFRSERYVRIPSDLLDQWIRERVKQNG